MAMSAEKTSEFEPSPSLTFSAPEALEFDALRELVGRYVRSPLGRASSSNVR